MKSTGERFIPEDMVGDIEVEHFHRYKSIINIVKNKKVLDAATGTGYGSYLLAQTAETVDSIDISEEAIKYAKGRYNRNNINYKVGNIAQLDFPDNYFDVIVSFETIEHVDEKIQKSFLKEIKRVLKKDGILIMSTPNKKTYSDDRKFNNEYHIKEFYEQEFIDFIGCEFKYNQMYYQYFSNTSILTSYDKIKLNAINFNNFNKGLYFIIIASNLEIDENIDINTVYYIPENINKTDDLIQVYYKDNELYNEENSKIIYIKRESKKFNIKIDLDNVNKKYIRIDPLTVSCILKINQIKIKFTDNSELECTNEIDTNAHIVNDNNYTFLTNDPQIYIKKIFNKSIRYIYIDYEIIDYSLNISEYFDEIIKEKENSILQLNQVINENYNTIKDKKLEIQNKEQEIQSKLKDIEEIHNTLTITKDILLMKEKYIEEIENSTGWKFLTKIKRMAGK